MFEATKDDIYAYALAKTLTKVSSPATVGLYSSCQNRINLILRQMEEYMKQDDRKLSIMGFLALIFRLLFCRPMWTEKNLQHHNIRFIYVHFSAWHFAGSDLLWAGLVIRLFQAMEINFGKLHLVLYRVAQHVEEEELKKKNLIFNEDLNIKKGMDNKQVSSQLGFMNEVRKEMWFLSRFIQFMEVFERRRIRVVLKITNLHRCSPKKIVAVLDAINILLSDEDSPFISILAVNPEVLIQKVNFADGCLSKEDRAYAMLNRIVTLAFTVPPLCDESKRSLFYNLGSISKILEDKCMKKAKHRPVSLENASSSDISLVEIAEESAFEFKEANPLMSKNTAALDAKEEEIDMCVRSILTSSERKLNKYMFDDAMSMRRVINSIRMTVIIIKALKIEIPQPEYVAAWVVLATQWPCRLSWIIQCAEDAQQRADIDGRNVADSKTLWKVFSKSRVELYVMRAQIEDLLEQDGDPEMFERFLRVDFQFTIKDLKLFELVTVNLDHTFRKELAQIRGTSRLKDSGWMRNLAPLPITTIINMDTQDVCKEMERMEYPSKYIDIVKSNDLKGSALVFGNADDLKDLLGMTFGEWTTFRLHFLGLPPHLRPQYKDTPLVPSQRWKSRIPLHIAHHYSSNPNLVDS
ncbi:NTPase KAP family P-loop domain-containing protein 1 isoform X2 [Channa argus]|uniref:NTPase KAP family P-loop domain-containing protein 1 isoform X2 n=1 Tax=Channa argus TaxID=215402 RepID=UPI003521C963